MTLECEATEQRPQIAEVAILPPCGFFARLMNGARSLPNFEAFPQKGYSTIATSVMSAHRCSEQHFALPLGRYDWMVGCPWDRSFPLSCKLALPLASCQPT